MPQTAAYSQEEQSEEKETREETLKQEPLHSEKSRNYMSMWIGVNGV